MSQTWNRLVLPSLLMIVGAASIGCTEKDPCFKNPPEFVEKFGAPEHQVTGKDGLCYAVDPDVPNWGSACGAAELCGAGLICAAPDLPICTNINCNPDPKLDTVCPKEGFACVKTGKESPPSICIPVKAPAATTTPPKASESPATSPSTTSVSDAGMTPPLAAAPNIGTACGAMGDTVCVNGAMCPGNPALPYCTVMSCAAGAANEGACSAAGGTCYTGPGAPADGICTVDPSSMATPKPNIGTACGDMGDAVCVNGAMCPGNPALPYCTVMSCAAGAANESACSDAGGTCYTGPGAPADGICTVQ